MNRPVYPILLFALLLLIQVSLAVVHKEETFTNDEIKETPTNDQRNKKISTTMASLNQVKPLFATSRRVYEVIGTLGFSFSSMWQKKKKNSDFHRSISENRLSKVTGALRTRTDSITTFHKLSHGPCDAKNSAIITVLPKVEFTPSHVARALHTSSDTFDAIIRGDHPSTTYNSAISVESSPEPHDALSSKEPGDIPLWTNFPAPTRRPGPKHEETAIIDLEGNNLGDVGFMTDLFQIICLRTCKRNTKTNCRPSKKNKVKDFKYCSEGDAIGFELARSCCFYEACYFSIQPQGQTLRKKWRRFVKRKLRKNCG